MNSSIVPPPSVVYVWYAYVAGLQAPALRTRCLALLDATEHAAHARIRVSRAQDAYLLAHALCRVALSHHHAGVAPNVWRFAPQPQGKPVIVAPASAASLQFNISHTQSMVAVAVSSILPVGIDVEDAHRPIDVAILAPRVLTSREQHACMRHATPGTCFLQYWTLKEAYLKAQGLGIAEGLTSIDMQLESGVEVDRPVAVQDARPHATAAAWHLRLLPIDAGYVMAAAVQASCHASSFVLSEAGALL